MPAWESLRFSSSRAPKVGDREYSVPPKMSVCPLTTVFVFHVEMKPWEGFRC